MSGVPDQDTLEAQRRVRAWKQAEASFEQALRAAVWVDLKRGRIDPVDVYAALINTEWLGPSGECAAYSFRAAGGLIAEMLGEGDYNDWYCSALHPEVSDDIRERMQLLGWLARPIAGV